MIATTTSDFANDTTVAIMTDSSSKWGINESLWRYGGTLILIIGTVGHILSITVMASSKSMRTQSSSVYIITMSITGIITLYTGLLRNIIFIGFSNWELDIREISNVFCKLHMSITYIALQYFAWLQATVAVDRLFSVKWPYKYMHSGKWKLGVVAILIELVIVVGLNIPLAIHVRIDDEGFCTPTDNFFQDIWGYIDLASYSLVPACFMTICNSFILYLLRKSKFKTGASNGALARSLTIMLMSLNVLFLITTLPISVVFFLEWGELGDKHYAAIEICWTVFSLMQYAGCACTFFIYCITGSKFREELQDSLKKFCPYFKVKSVTTTRSTKALSLHRKSKTPVPFESADYKSLNVSITAEETSMTQCM